MIALNAMKHPETGRDMVVAVCQTQEILEPLQLLRGLKQKFPALWQQVNMELQLPPSVQQEAAKIVGVNGD